MNWLLSGIGTINLCVAFDLLSGCLTTLENYVAPQSLGALLPEKRQRIAWQKLRG